MYKGSKNQHTRPLLEITSRTRQRQLEAETSTPLTLRHIEHWCLVCRPEGMVPPVWNEAPKDQNAVWPLRLLAKRGISMCDPGSQGGTSKRTLVADIVKSLKDLITVARRCKEPEERGSLL